MRVTVEWADGFTVPTTYEDVAVVRFIGDPDHSWGRPLPPATVDGSTLHLNPSAVRSVRTFEEPAKTAIPRRELVAAK